MQQVVLSGVQRYVCMQYTTPRQCGRGLHGLFYQDFNEQFAAKVLKNHEIYKFTRKYFDTSEKKLLLRLFDSCKSSVNSKIDKIQRHYD